MGRASFECWAASEGLNSIRTLDNMHDYALELAMLGREEDGIATWQVILERCPSTDANENTKILYNYRSMAGIAEFQGDAAMAEIFYEKLIKLCEAMYHSEHIHLFDYRLSHAEQIMLQGRLEEATQLSEAVLTSSERISEWRISASCLQNIAACYRSKAVYSEELPHRIRILKLYETRLGSDHKETVDAEEALAICYLYNYRPSEAEELYQRVVSWRNTGLGQTHVDTVRATECVGICRAYKGQDAAAETAYLNAIGQQTNPDARILDNLQTSLRNQGKWEALESWSRQACQLEYEDYRLRAQQNLIRALEQQDKTGDALEMRASLLGLQEPDKDPNESRRLPTHPPLPHVRRFGIMLHPKTWSA